MKPEIVDNPIVKKLIVLKRKHCPESIRWFISATYWDDGDYELKLRTSWADNTYDFFYRKSLNKYYYTKTLIGKYKDMLELK